MPSFALPEVYLQGAGQDWERTVSLLQSAQKPDELSRSHWCANIATGFCTAICISRRVCLQPSGVWQVSRSRLCRHAMIATDGLCDHAVRLAGVLGMSWHA
jgi:hypothetical protein